MGRTLYDKLWDDHVVHTEDDGTTVLYIDRHLTHEVTSPQAYEGLREAGRKVWRVSSVVATADHNTPTDGWENGYDGLTDPISKEQIVTLDKNIAEFGCFVGFLNGVTALAPKNFLSDHFVSNPADHYTLGQSVRCCVVSVDAPARFPAGGRDAVLPRGTGLRAVFAHQEVSRGVSSRHHVSGFGGARRGRDDGERAGAGQLRQLQRPGSGDQRPDVQ
jgi:hypothetical protein